MAFCSQCGAQVGEQDGYCGGCGAKQPVPERPASGMFSNLSARNASLLCYIPLVGWIPAIVVLASSRFRHEQAVRFHAFQGLYLFVAWLIVDWAVAPFFGVLPSAGLRVSVTGVLKAAIFFTWIFMIIKTSHNETYRLPILGELAERSIAEQR